MDTAILNGSPAATLEVLLDDPGEHDCASMRRLLGGLSGEQAVTVLTELPYSIASLLAHMNRNVLYNLELIQSDGFATFSNPCENWPAVEADARPTWLRSFSPAWTPSSAWCGTRS